MDITSTEYIFGSLFLLSNRLQALGDAYLREITLKQWFLLIMIHNLEQKPASVTQVAAFTGSTRQNVRKMLEVLAGKGYVRLVVNPTDKRNLSVCLTEQTYRFFEAFNDAGSAFLARLFSGISPEQLAGCGGTFEVLLQNIERMENSSEKNSSHL